MKITAIAIVTLLGLSSMAMIPQRCQQVVTNDRPWLTEEEFQANPLLHATSDQVIVFELEPVRSKAGRSNSAGDKRGHGPHLIRNTVSFLVRDKEPEKFSFCIAEDDPYIKTVELETFAGQAVWRHQAGSACTPVALPAGRYRLSVLHDPTAIPPGGVKAFLHRPQQARLLGSSQNDFTAPDDFVFKGPNGKFVGLKGTLQSYATQVLPFEVWRMLQGSPNEMQLYGNGEIVVALDTGDIQPLTVGAGNPNYNVQQIHFTELSDGQFTMGTSDSLGQAAVNLGGTNPDELVRNFLDETQTPFTLDYKVFECTTCDAGTLPLQEGEVALFTECNYQGPAFVFQADIPDLSVYNGVSIDESNFPVGIGDNQVSSVRVGPNALAVLYDEAQFGGTALGIRADTPCLDNTALGSGTASSVLITTDIRRFVIATDACENCNLTGIDLSSEDLTAGQFSGSNFTSANLTDTNLQMAQLDHAIFTRATLDNTDFTGAVLDCTHIDETDLTTATFDANPKVTEDFSCRLNLSRSSLPVNKFSPTYWRYFNLTNATVVGADGTTLSTLADPLDLSGAMLSGVTGLSGVILDGADLGCATGPNGQNVCTQLIDAKLGSSSLRQAILENAAMNGVTLSFANLAGANLSGAQLLKSDISSLSATLEGALLKNVNLSQADLSGANLNHANWYSTSADTSTGVATCPGAEWTGRCASAEGATLNSAKLEGAYLSDLDLTDSTPQGADFSGAILVGANFTDANLGNDPDTGVATSFAGAFLQGTSFTDATTTGADFTSAYLDVTGGILLFQLSEASLEFAGFTPANGSIAGCVESIHQSMDAISIQSTAENHCPDGNNGPCSDAQWLSPITPIADAVPPSTSDTESGLPSGCNGSTIDFNWMLQ